MMRRIFIGGTGRSGTSILKKALGSHRDIHDFPKELRFIVDPDGLMDLVDALTVRYSPTQARETLHKFERLMRVYMTHPDRSPYPGFDFPGWFGKGYYWQRLDRFCSALVREEFEGIDWLVELPAYEGRLVNLAKSLRDGKRNLLGQEPILPRLELPRPKLKSVRYFSSRDELVALAASFLDDLFTRAANEHGKKTWIEKTPNNLLHADFLWELFPDSLFIHIKRDPRGIVHSMKKYGWIPSTVEGVCWFLIDIYDRWFDLKQALDLDKFCYLEMKLEDLALSPRPSLEKIVAMADLPYDFVDPPEIQIEKVNYWKEVMPAEELETINRILGPYIEKMGYEI
jgi:hypothetical protein